MSRLTSKIVREEGGAFSVYTQDPPFFTFSVYQPLALSNRLEEPDVYQATYEDVFPGREPPPLFRASPIEKDLWDVKTDSLLDESRVTLPTKDLKIILKSLGFSTNQILNTTNPPKS